MKRRRRRNGVFLYFLSFLSFFFCYEWPYFGVMLCFFATMNTPTTQRLMVIDGNAVLHRAWHALPPLTTKTGLVVTGVYGFTMLLLRAINEIKPTHIAVTFDLAGPTFRHDEFADYKATREKKPDELYAQIPLIKRVLEAMRISVFEAKGYEADDVIGTLASLSPIPTVIVTGDMDTLQLVNEKTVVFTLRKGLTDTVIYDIKGVENKMFGLKPAQMIDYKALRGDASDNIPGVKGIGEKTAAELLTVFGTLEDLYASIEAGDAKAAKLKAGVREKLVAGKKDALMAKRLVTIVCDVPFEFRIDACAYRPVTREMVREIFEEFQFTRLLQQVPSENGAEERESGKAEGKKERKERKDKKVDATSTMDFSAPVAEVILNATNIVDEKGVQDFFEAAEYAGQFAFHFVASADLVHPEVRELFLASNGKAWRIILQGGLPEFSRKLIGEMFASEKLAKICHDVKTQYASLDELKIIVGGKIFDLMVASYVIHGADRRHGLDTVLAMYRSKRLGTEVGDATLADAVLVMPGLAEEMAAEMDKDGSAKVFTEIEMPLTAVLRRMERHGIEIDADWFAKFSLDLGKKIDALLKDVYKVAGKEFNLNSPAQLQEILFTTLGLSAEGMKKTAKNKSVSTAASELEKLRDQHPIIEMMLAYREATKLKSTYVDAIPLLVNPATQRVHAKFNQTVAATGRLSSADPNLQNIPTPETEYGKRVRDGFVAAKGYVFVAADYSQFELRVAAHLAQEPSMIDAFKRGEDIHQRTAATMFGEEQAASHRRIAKVINFGILYGMGPRKLAENAGISFEQARKYIEQYFALLPNIQKYIDGTVEKMKRDGYVETLFGRRRSFANYRLMDKREQAEAERQAVNMPIQGTQADIVKLAMLAVDREISSVYGVGEDSPVRMLVQVHDELIFEVKKNKAEEIVSRVLPIMESAWKLDVPIVVNASVGERWGSLKKLV